MARASSRPTVFVGSSTPALPIAQELRRGLRDVAEVIVWDTAFDAGTWLLGGILNQARQSDFALFVIREDDTVKLKGTDYTTMRDNVLFEAGVFMGAIGPERSILLWPTSSASNLRLPTDLQGLLREPYTPPKSERDKPNIRTAPASLRRRIEKMGPALRSGYNEIAALKQTLFERDVEFQGGSAPLLTIIERAAKLRNRPWYAATKVEKLTGAMETHYVDEIVDDVYWWLVIYGVITFNNIDEWTSEEWYYKDSIEYAVFTERGLVLLNELRASSSGKR